MSLPFQAASLRRALRSAALLVSLALAMAASCANHGVGFVVRTRSDAPADIEKAVAATESVAERFHMSRQVDARTDPPALLPDESRLLLEFQSVPARGKVADDERSRIVLALSASRDGSQLRFVLQDLDRGSESPWFGRIEAALDDALAEAFPGRAVERQGGRVSAGVP